MSTTLNKLASNLNKKAAINPEVLKYLAMYGAPTIAGAGIGALVDKKKRLRGGLLGALLGAGTGGLIHGGKELYEFYQKYPGRGLLEDESSYWEKQDEVAQDLKKV